MSYTPFFSGRNSFLQNAINSLFFGGSDNSLSASSNSMIIGGSGNTVEGQFNGMIYTNDSTLSGYRNNIFGSNNCGINTSSGSSIIDSDGSYINSSTGSTIITTTAAGIENAYYSSIISSQSSTMIGTFQPIISSAIIGGESHQIGFIGSAKRSIIAGGYSNDIGNAPEYVEDSGIFAGSNNTIDSQSGNITRDCAIVGSSSCLIDDGSMNSSILGCRSLTIDSSTGVTAIGMSSGTITAKAYTTYVNKININDIIKLNPLSSDPLNPAQGDIYFRSGVGIKFYDGAVWRTINFT